MYGLVFQDEAPAAPAAPNRMDIACFAGFCGEAAGPAVAVGSWQAFRARFGAGYLAAAVRAFFAQGGRQCYVVPAGPAPAPGQPAAEAAARLLPGFPATLRVDAMDPATWTGAAQILALPDAAMLCLPDLAWLFVPPPEPAPPVEERPGELPEIFVECASRTAAKRGEDPAQRAACRAPRYDDAAYEAWTRALSLAVRLLAQYRRDVQCVASLPLAARSHRAARDPLSALAPELRSRFLQLAWPWLRTSWSSDLPDGVEPAEGALAGLLARNALTRGAFHSAIRLPLTGVSGVEPAPSRELLALADARRTAQYTLSVFAPEPAGVQLISDNTADAGVYRPAAVQRLAALILRAAQRAGADVVFENSGEALWRTLRERVSRLMERLFELGALRGASAEDAFRVRCDRSTMSQADLDNGCLVVEIELAPAAPVERITVSLALAPNGLPAAAEAA